MLNLNLSDTDVALRDLGFSFGGLRLTTEATPYTHPALPPGMFVAVDGFTGDTSALAAALASLPPELTAEQRLAREAVRVADGTNPIEVAIRVMARMLQEAVAETRVRVNALQSAMVEAGLPVGGLPPLVNYPSFEAAVAAFKSALSAV